MYPFPFKYNTPECYEAISVTSDCVQASSFANDSSVPSKALDTGDQAWSPAVRTGKMWREYLLFDLKASIACQKCSITQALFFNTCTAKN